MENFGKLLWGSMEIYGHCSLFHTFSIPSMPVGWGFVWGAVGTKKPQSLVLWALEVICILL